MFLRAVLLVVVAAIAVQSYVPYDAKEQLALLNVQGDSIIDQLREVIEKSVKAAKQALDTLNQNLIDKIRQLIESAKSAFTKQVQALLEKIKKFQEEAEKVKVDTTECVKDHEAEMNQISNEFTKKVTECNEATISKGKAIIDKEKQTAEQTIEIVEKLAKDFKTCGSGLESIKCKAGVAINIGKAILEIPATIKKIVAEAGPALLNLVPGLQQCVVDNTKDLITREEKIEKEIETCIENKIHPH